LDEPPPPPVASFSFSRDETDYEDISEYQKNIDHHIHSILSLRDSQSWNDFYFYDNMTMMTTTNTTTSNGGQLMKNPSSRNSLRFKLNSNNNQKGTAEKKPLLPTPPPPPLSINKNDLVFSPMNSLFGSASSHPSVSWSNDLTEGGNEDEVILIPKNISQDSLLGSHSHSPIAEQGNRNPAIVLPSSHVLRTPLSSNNKNNHTDTTRSKKSPTHHQKECLSHQRLLGLSLM
jgi:hypothetical protein